MQKTTNAALPSVQFDEPVDSRISQLIVAFCTCAASDEGLHDGFVTRASPTSDFLDLVASLSLWQSSSTLEMGGLTLWVVTAICGGAGAAGWIFVPKGDNQV